MWKDRGGNFFVWTRFPDATLIFFALLFLGLSPILFLPQKAVLEKLQNRFYCSYWENLFFSKQKIRF